MNNDFCLSQLTVRFAGSDGNCYPLVIEIEKNYSQRILGSNTWADEKTRVSIGDVIYQLNNRLDVFMSDTRDRNQVALDIQFLLEYIERNKILINHRLCPIIGREQFYKECVEKYELQGLMYRLRLSKGRPPPRHDSGPERQYSTASESSSFASPAASTRLSSFETASPPSQVAIRSLIRDLHAMDDGARAVGRSSAYR